MMSFLWKSATFWNSAKPMTYSYYGKISTDYMGNFWSNYVDSDNLNDGLGDKPYALDSDKDWHPLISRFRIYDLKVGGDTFDLIGS